MNLIWYLIGLGMGLFFGFGFGLVFAAVSIIRGWSPYFTRR